VSDQPKPGLGRRLLLAGLLVALLAGGMPVGAATTPAPIDAESPTMGYDALRAFSDAFVTEALTTYALPGLAVADVAGGELASAEGYGYADLERGIPVAPETTLFDVGSVAKLFTFTAVMQLVQEGRLDLHADVNRYLTHFQVPATFDEPVTAAHVLAHTGGFDEWDIGAAVRTPEEVLPVCEYLAQRLPPRVRTPGELIAYSNHGTALAGCLVEEIPGAPFAPGSAGPRGAS
jgi:CubicO group peptidase (beta-lactamase class C family)